MSTAVQACKLGLVRRGSVVVAVPRSRKNGETWGTRRPYAPESRDGSERITQRYWRIRRIRDLRSSTALGGLAHPVSLILTLGGAPSLSRFLRQGGEFDLPRTGWSRSRNPRPVPARSTGTRTGHALEQLVTKRAGQLPASEVHRSFALLRMTARAYDFWGETWGQTGLTPISWRQELGERPVCPRISPKTRS